jgi:hypothetical protein
MSTVRSKQLHYPLSGSFTGSFSGSFTGDGSGIINISASSIIGLNLSQIATGSVTASVTTGPFIFNIKSGSSTYFSLDNTGSVSISGSLTLNDGNGLPYFFLVKSGSRNIFKVNSQGVVENNVFDTGSIPTAVYGGIYFTSQSVFVGLDQATFN